MATITRAEAEALLTARGWTFDDVALAVATAHGRKRDEALAIGRELGIDSGTAAQLIEVAKSVPPA